MCRLAASGAKLWLDPSSVNAAIVSIFKSACDKHNRKTRKGENKEVVASIKNQDIQAEGPFGLYKVSPVTMAKAVKNRAEIEGMRNSHLR